MKKLILFLIFLFIARFASFAGEGIWLPLLLKALNESEMKRMGMKMSAEDIYSVNNGSLKDAIVQFGGGCTAEIISPNGLILTNHHCGYGRIQSHSTLENNYLKDGFWAKDQSEELPNESLSATLIVQIEDVSKMALEGVEESMDKSSRQSVVDKNLNSIREKAQREDWQDVMIRPFFHGNQYFLFITETFTDVRLVGAPPSSIGKFGADTDNWVWPRHTGDFSLFRIYADQNNHPADFSENNKPYTPKHYLPISLDGVSDGDFTLVFGFPGRTSEYLPAAAVEQIKDVLDPAKISVRDRTLNIWDAAMRADAEVKIQYASKQSGISNAWKKWQGEVLGLNSSRAVEEKRAFEKKFMIKAKANPSLNKYVHLLGDFEKLYKDIEPYALAKAYYDEITARNVEILRVGRFTNTLVQRYEDEGEAGFENYRKRLKRFLNGYYKNYRSEIDQDVFAVQMDLLMGKVNPEYIPAYVTEFANSFGGDYEKMATAVFEQSFLDDAEQAMSTLDMAPGDVMKAIQNDPAYLLAKAFKEVYDNKIVNKYNELNSQITELQQVYMKALMEVFKGEKFYPDANGTLRVSYGQVEGAEPRDGISYKSKTYLDGIMEKYVPGDYEFDVPEKLQQLYAKRDYGRYAEGRKMPVCFIGSNHTTGGNSGSPAIDAHGNLVGLNFDRAWEGTMSDYYYDIKLCRNIMVDVRYVLFIIDKFAGAKHLVDEMKLVYPKTGEKRKELIKPRTAPMPAVKN